MASTSSPNINDSSKGFISKVFEVDTDAKNGLMNGIQYIVLAIIPLAILDMIVKNLFPSNDPSTKGSVELLAEVLGQVVITIVLIFMVHRVISAVPTYTDTPMTRINYSTISLGFLITTFALNHSMSYKISTIFNRLRDSWEGKSEETATKHSTHRKDNSKVSVSQPISGMHKGDNPTHQASRADYVGNHNQMMPVQPPPIVPRQQQNQPQQEPSTGQQMYGGPSNSLVGTDFNPAEQEPIAANGVLGGGGWGAW